MIERQDKVAVAARDGSPIDTYVLTAGPHQLRVLTLGGAITHLRVPDRAGVAGDVVLGFDEAARYEQPGPYFGALIGRVANRTANGRFTLDGRTHAITANDGPHQLHGGRIGYDKRVWTARADGMDDAAPTLRLSLLDPDGTEGFPGTVDVGVTYALSADGVLRIEYVATADAPTPVNLTNHTYFNLQDAGALPITGHVLTLDASRYTPVDATLMPTGELATVAGTPMDFRAAKPIGRDLAAAGGSPIGFDHNFAIDGSTDDTDEPLRRCARVVEPTTGRSLECWTTQPGVQFYSGNFLDGTISGKGGLAYQQYAGFCLETQHFPNSANEPRFPSITLRPGETFRSVTEYRFGIE